jgi:glycosyltransferase involved in cell wall biosynthesis
MSMEKISGFSLVRNGIKFDYPFLESWRSILPVVDELVLNLGKSDDESLAIAQQFAREEGQGKVRIIETEWPLNDPAKKKSGLILSEQTNIALEACQYDWCFYIQADEVIHEADVPVIRKAVEQAAKQDLDAVVFEYCHFYGSFNVIQQTRSAYRREMRIIRKSSGARSVGDAQSFRKPDGEKLNAVLSKARIFHYGWVRTPDAMKEKTVFMDQLYHGDQAANASVPHSGDNYRYKSFWGLKQYQGSHPAVMNERIRAKGWNWDLKHSEFVFSWSDVKKAALDLYEQMTGHRPFEFKNYRIKERLNS